MAHNRSDHPFGGADVVQVAPVKPYSGLCRFCKTRPATLHFGDAMSYIHGGSIDCCKICALQKQIEHAIERSNALPDLLDELADLMEAEYGSTTPSP